jgi:predicted RNase H-like HicB family nuclease
VIRGEKTMKYAVIFEEGASSWAASVPDLPGCYAIGESLGECRTLIADAVRQHIQSLRESGEQVPSPTSTVEIVEIAA